MSCHEPSRLGDAPLGFAVGALAGVAPRDGDGGGLELLELCFKRDGAVAVAEGWSWSPASLGVRLSTTGL
jgi:hypothetical protein